MDGGRRAEAPPLWCSLHDILRVVCSASHRGRSQKDEHCRSLCSRPGWLPGGGQAKILGSHTAVVALLWQAERFRRAARLADSPESGSLGGQLGCQPDTPSFARPRGILPPFSEPGFALCSASWAQIGRDVHAEQAKAIAIVTAAFFVVNRLSNFFFRITGLVKDDYRRNMLGSCVGSVVHCVAVSIATYEELNSRGWTLFGFYTGANGSGFSHVLSHYARSSTHSTAQVECACRVRVRTDGAGVAAAGRSSTWARRIRQRGLLLSSFALDTCSLTR
jgi:hypothetical protein